MTDSGLSFLVSGRLSISSLRLSASLWLSINRRGRAQTDLGARLSLSKEDEDTWSFNQRSARREKEPLLRRDREEVVQERESDHAYAKKRTRAEQLREELFP